MLYIVLLLVLVALGLLIAAFATANTLWAWLSIGISVVGAAVLVLDWMGNRRRKAVPDPVAEPEPVEAEVLPVVEPEDDPEPIAQVEALSQAPAAEPDSDEEPAEEGTDAADLLIVADLTVEVRVVDERPRYHLATCPWLVGRATIGVPASEARRLGFTPCARCTPDAVLAERHRARKQQRAT